MFTGYVIYKLAAHVSASVIKHIGVGFCVARSDRKGNAKTSKCGTSNRYRFPRFFYVCFRSCMLKCPFSGICGRNTQFTMNTNVLRIVASVCTCVVMLSCGSNKVVQSGKKYANPFESGAYELPCAVYDDDEYFAATGMAAGPATQKGILQMTALKNGQDMIAMKMQHAVEGEIMGFFESIGSNEGTDVDTQTLGGINNIIMGIVNETSHCCLKFSGVDAKGNVECYIGIKIPKEDIANAVADNLSQHKKEDIRNRAEEFRKKLSEDLKHYRGE